MSRLSDVVARYTAQQIKHRRQVRVGRYLRPFGLRRGVVRVGACQDQELTADRLADLAPDDPVLVVSDGSGAGARSAILSAPVTRPGPTASYTVELAGSTYVAPPPDPNPGPTFAMRFLEQISQPDYVSTRVVDGEWNLAAYINFGDVDELNNPAQGLGNILATVTWPGLAPVSEGDNTNPLKVTPLPSGLDTLAAGSLAATTEQDNSTTLWNSGGKSSFKVWDSDSGAFVTHETTIAGRRFRQPVLVGGAWYTVQYDVDAFYAPRLLRLKGDLSEAATEISAAPTTEVDPLWCNFTDGVDLYAPIMTSNVTAPTECWRFPLNGDTVTRVSYSQAADFYEFRCRAHSAIPVGGKVLHGVSGSAILKNNVWTEFSSARVESDTGLFSWPVQEQLALTPAPFPTSRPFDHLLCYCQGPGAFSGFVRLGLWNAATGAAMNVSPGPAVGRTLAAWFV